MLKAMNKMSTQMFQIDRDTMGRLMKMSKETNLTPSDLVRKAINLMVDAWEEFKQKVPEQTSVSTETVE
jgi:hypothetical protein